MRRLRTEQEIIQAWKGDLSKPLISICCSTYNHEPYIEDALEGFLIQETDFPFEIIIHDDASTDRTANIIREYVAKYSNLIVPICQVENQHSKRGRIGPDFVFPRVKGKYIAICEGDDFWTDPRKLQIQIDFLESNPDIVISGHDAFIIDDSGKRIADSKLPDANKRDYSGEELIMGEAGILTLSWVYRKVNVPYPPERNKVKNGDGFDISLLGEFGGSHYHENIKPAAYRIHDGGIWSALNDDNKRDEKTNTWFWMYRYYKRVGKHRYANIFLNRFKETVCDRMSTRELFLMVFFRIIFFRQAKVILKRELSDSTLRSLKAFLGRKKM